MSIAMPAITRANTRIVRLQGGGLRFLDAHEAPLEDFQVVTRPLQRFDATQQWRLTDLGGDVVSLQQVSSGRFLSTAPDFRVVTRPQRNSDFQRWRLEDFGNGFLTIQQVGSGRFLEATVHGDFSVVTRPPGDSEQVWRIGVT
jgi:hypothetical protein